MKSSPMLFNGPMVCGLLDDSKTQTRRIVKPRADKDMGKRCMLQPHELAGEVNSGNYRNNPYGQPGDQLWVRETWNWFDPDSIPTDRAGPRAIFTGNQGNRSIPWVAAYAADGHLPYPGYEGRDHWRPSIHMPRWASRITLEITGVRVERLQDISIEDCKAEGAWGPDESIVSEVENYFLCDTLSVNPRLAYQMLWERINGDKSWDANPLVWVVEFKRVTP